MEEIRFENNDELLGYLITELDTEENIDIICDHYIVKELMDIYNDESEDFDFFCVNIASDINEYVVGRIGMEHFSIEPIKHIGKYLNIVAKKLIILDSMINDEMLSSCEFEELEILSIEEDDKPCDCKNCYCDECCCNNEDENTEEDEALIKLSSMIEKYSYLIEDNEYNEKAVRHALMEFADEIMENFCVEEIEDQIEYSPINITVNGGTTCKELEDTAMKLIEIFKRL